MMIAAVSSHRRLRMFLAAVFCALGAHLAAAAEVGDSGRTPPTLRTQTVNVDVFGLG